MRKRPPGIPNELFTYERNKRRWTQGYIAQRLDMLEDRTVRRWERGESLPEPHFHRQLEMLFGKSKQELGFLEPGEMAYWHVPYSRNVLFTGREDILQKQLHDIFVAQRTDSTPRLPLALSGLGGVGKSQIAAEYAYRCRHQFYEDTFPVHTVLWLHASSRQAFLADVAALAQILDLPGKDEADIRQLIATFKAWLTQLTRWLLIFDDVEDFELFGDILPDEIKGRVLLTTQSHPTGTFAQRIPVEPLNTDAGAELLLRRAKLLPSEHTFDQAVAADKADARSLSKTLGGLPLALDQAGAYIEEVVISPADYAQIYQQQRSERLAQRGAVVSRESEHPESVEITVSLSVQKACERHPLARNILDFCTFLQPDAIPEELFQADEGFTFGTSILNDGIAALLRYSLVNRHPQEKTLSMHRLVQAVLQDTLEEKRHSWIQRAVRAVNVSFPDPEFGGTWPQRDWPQCERLVRHGTQIAPYTETEHIVSFEVGALLHKTALYLWNRRDFTKVEQLYQQALQVKRQSFGPEHPTVAASLNGLANLYYEQGRYAEAEPLYQQALQMRECLLGPDHPDLVSSLNGLAKLSYYAKTDYARAEVLYQRAIQITEKHLGYEHPYRAYLLLNLANLYSTQEQYKPAEVRYRNAIRIWEQQLGPQHPSTALAFNNLGVVYLRKHDYLQAGACFRRARQLWEEVLGKTSLRLVAALNNLAEAYLHQGKYAEAEPLYRQALLILEEHGGPEDADLVYPLSGLAELSRRQGKYSESWHHYKRALRLQKRVFGLQHPNTAEILDGLAQLEEAQGYYEKARILYTAARAVREQAFGLAHAATKETNQRLLALLRTMGRHDEAAQLEEILQIAENASESGKSSG